MREKPILFSGPMVQAILDGRKTMTRRVVKPQPEGQLECVIRHEVGTKLWVREAWAANIPGCPNGITYKADHIDPKGDGPANPIKWKPSIHMPKAAARIWLEVVNVRVERLQEITYDDCLREGMWNCGTDVKTLAAFQDLWQNLNAKRGFGWDTNPWVFVVEFKRLEAD